MTTFPRWSWRFPPNSVLFTLQTPSRSGGQSTDGYEQVVQSSAGRWMATLQFHISPQRGGAGAGVLYWRWFVGYMQGRANTIAMPVFDRGQTPAQLAGQPIPAPVTHDDGSLFSDGSAYRQPRTPAHVAGAYSGGETSMLVNMLGNQSPQPGQYFSVADRLYLIETAAPYLGAVTVGSPNYWELGLWPPVREAIADGAWAEFDDPTCLVRLAKDATAALALTPGYRGDVTVDLVEAPLGG
jgi:hypothetical protein